MDYFGVGFALDKALRTVASTLCSQAPAFISQALRPVQALTRMVAPYYSPVKQVIGTQGSTHPKALSLLKRKPGSANLKVINNTLERRPLRTIAQCKEHLHSQRNGIIKAAPSNPQSNSERATKVQNTSKGKVKLQPETFESRREKENKDPLARIRNKQAEDCLLHRSRNVENLKTARSNNSMHSVIPTGFSRPSAPSFSSAGNNHPRADVKLTTTINVPRPQTAEKNTVAAVVEGGAPTSDLNFNRNAFLQRRQLKSRTCKAVSTKILDHGSHVQVKTINSVREERQALSKPSKLIVNQGTPTFIAPPL